MGRIYAKNFIIKADNLIIACVWSAIRKWLYLQLMRQTIWMDDSYSRGCWLLLKNLQHASPSRNSGLASILKVYEDLKYKLGIFHPSNYY